MTLLYTQGVCAASAIFVNRSVNENGDTPKPLKIRAGSVNPFYGAVAMALFGNLKKVNGITPVSSNNLNIRKILTMALLPPQTETESKLEYGEPSSDPALTTVTINSPTRELWYMDHPNPAFPRLQHQIWESTGEGEPKHFELVEHDGSKAALTKIDAARRRDENHIHVIVVSVRRK
tara:strand:+ start:340 stop:870 length:531 start_codon:yes stop_codon:yes gene_type:complete